MSERARLVFNWLRYADYVLAWAEIPIDERPRYRVERSGDNWKAMLV